MDDGGRDDVSVEDMFPLPVLLPPTLAHGSLLKHHVPVHVIYLSLPAMIRLPQDTRCQASSPQATRTTVPHQRELVPVPTSPVLSCTICTLCRGPVIMY